MKVRHDVVFEHVLRVCCGKKTTRQVVVSSFFTVAYEPIDYFLRVFKCISRVFTVREILELSAINYIENMYDDIDFDSVVQPYLELIYLELIILFILAADLQ